MSKPGKRRAATLQESTVRAVAVSTAVSGAIAAGQAVRSRQQKRARREERRRYRLYREETPARGVGWVARGQLDTATDLLERSDGGDLGESIHEARKTMKRLRALLRVSRSLLDDESYRRENMTLRDVGRELSDARDAQVLVETLDELTRRFGEELPAGAFERFRQELAADADAAAAGMQDHTALPKASGTLRDVRMRVPTWALPDDGGPESLAGGFERIYRRGRRALHAAEAGGDGDGEHMHELRKRAKDLWHAAQLLRPMAPKKMKKLARRGHRVSDLLGDDHDLLVLRGRARSAPELFDADELELLCALIDRRRSNLQEEALERASRLYSRKPRKMRRLARG